MNFYYRCNRNHEEDGYEIEFNKIDDGIGEGMHIAVGLLKDKKGSSDSRCATQYIPRLYRGYHPCEYSAVEFHD